MIQLIYLIYLFYLFYSFTSWRSRRKQSRSHGSHSTRWSHWIHGRINSKNTILHRTIVETVSFFVEKTWKYQKRFNIDMGSFILENISYNHNLITDSLNFTLILFHVKTNRLIWLIWFKANKPCCPDKFRFVINYDIVDNWSQFEFAKFSLWFTKKSNK